MAQAGNNHISTGIEEIDNQHRELIAKFDEFVAAVENNEGRGKLASLVLFLVLFTKSHFATEENYHRLYGYPGADSHREAHGTIRENLLKLKAELEEEGASDALVQSTSRMMVRCLVEHFCKADKEFADFVMSRKAT